MTPDQNETKLVAVQPGNMLAFLCKILCSLNYSLLLYGVHVRVDHVMARLFAKLTFKVEWYHSSSKLMHMLWFNFILGLNFIFLCVWVW